MIFASRLIPAICFSTAVLCALSAAFALFGNCRSPLHRAFALGMAAFSVESVLICIGLSSLRPDEALLWLRWGMVAEALVPGSWLLFSLAYARSNFGEFARKWRWVIFAAFAVPAGLALLGWNFLFTGAVEVSEAGNWVFPIGWCGFGFNCCMLACSLLVVANLEKTLRASYGAIRQRIKFSILGVGLIFAALIYTSAQVLLVRSLRADLFIFDGVVLDIANLLLIISALRNRLREEKIYVSQDILRGSLTVLVLGFYLLGLGLFVKVAEYFRISRIVFTENLMIVAAILGGAVLLLSEEIRYRLRRFVHLNFRKPYYDYRKIWTVFTKKTSSLADRERVCEMIVKTVSETFTSPVVTIWLDRKGAQRPVIAASTAPLPEEVAEFEEHAATLLGVVRDRQEPIVVDSGAASQIPEASLEFFKRAKIRYCVPLGIGSRFIGMMTLNNGSRQPFSIEDLDLLETLAEQAAGLILNQELFERRERVMEMEAFRIFSSFFAHDLKNVASTLALTLTNLPLHYKDPEFRADTLQVMSKTIEKIKKMCSRLSSLDPTLELHKCPTDLNELVSGTVAELELGRPIAIDPGAVPKCALDPEQIQKVLLNLLLNAGESSIDGAQVRVSTHRHGDWIRVSVKDSGCGMSPEFMSQSLFHPFRTTKKDGSGIGLYQSRMIVEAHGGRIEVESLEGRGSTFSVFLPVEEDAGQG